MSKKGPKTPDKVPHDTKRALDANSETENGPMRFRGKVAFWWYATVVLMLACTLGMAVQGVAEIVNSDSKAALLILGAIIFLVFDIFLIDSCIKNYVVLNNRSLTVRVSVLTEAIPYSSISLAKESHNVLASLSTSLDRILIRYGSQNNVVLVAVKDKEGFLSELHKRSPHIHIERKA